MCPIINFRKVIHVQVGIFLGSRQTGMAKEFLHRPEVGSHFQKVGSEGVPERVDTEVLFQCGLLEYLPDPPLDGSTGKTPTLRIEKEGRRIGRSPPTYDRLISSVFVTIQGLKGPAGQRHDAFLLPLSSHLYLFGPQVHLTEIQVVQFGEADPAPIEKFQDQKSSGALKGVLGRPGLGEPEYRIYLRTGEMARETLLGFRGPNGSGRIEGDSILEMKEPEEAAYR